MTITPAEESRRPRSFAVRLALAAGLAIVVALASRGVQELLGMEHSTSITAAVAAVSAALSMMLTARRPGR